MTTIQTHTGLRLFDKVLASGSHVDFVPAQPQEDGQVSRGTQHVPLFEVLAWAASFINGLANELMDGSCVAVDKTALDLLAKLCAVSRYPKSDAFMSSPRAEDLEKELVSDLEAIITWPRSRKSTRPPLADTLASLAEVRRRHRDKIKKAEAKTTVAMFLSDADIFHKEEVIEACKRILYQLPADSFEEGAMTDDEGISHHMTEKMLASIWRYSVCDLCEDVTEVNADRHVTRYHPVRLYLGRPLHTEGDAALFDIVVSTHSFEYWQEIGLCDSRKRKVRLSESPHSSSLQDVKTKASSICNILADQTYARIHLELGSQHLLQDDAVHELQHDTIAGEGIPLERVLQEYNLSVAQKVALSYTVALAFWQFYDTKLMMAKWTSRNIWFMPQNQASGEELPCKMYISIPFEQSEYELDECSTASLIHKCPRIFALAVLLLEISLARPIQTCQLRSTERGFVGQMNRDYSAARRHLTELRRQSWENHQGKRTYDLAVDACMTGSNFLPYRQAFTDMTAATRRNIFYKEVVSPLQKLASSFAQDHVTNIKRKQQPHHQDTIQDSAIGAPNPIDDFIPSTVPAYQSGTSFRPEEWLQGLKEIAIHIYKLYATATTAASIMPAIRPVRVAILDSGCNMEIPYFKDDETGRRKRRVKAWKDFFHRSTGIQDSYGHGSLMAKLVIETAVTADLYVARVSDGGDLDGSERAVSQAIEWAGINCEADIILMSFGVDDEEGLIEASILNVRHKRKGNVIFLAAAGNSGVYEDVTRPASYSNVISIRAATSWGVMAATNPATDLDGPVSFATFGDTIPNYLCDYRPEICKPGSSVSTAVAAGIAASMLLYAQVLLSSGAYSQGDRQHIVQKLRTTEGMEALFRKISTPGPGRTYFINPVHFFASRKTRLQRICAIIDSLKG